MKIILKKKTKIFPITIWENTGMTVLSWQKVYLKKEKKWKSMILFNINLSITLATPCSLLVVVI